MIRAFTIVFAALVFTACTPRVQGNGKVKSETRETAPFNAVDIDGAFEVYLTPADYSSLKVEADENLHQYIESYVENEVLYVSSTRRIGRHHELNLHLNVSDLRMIDASGASEFETRGMLRGEQLKLDFSGAVEADLELDYDKLNGDFSGACELNLRGNASRAVIDASGAVEVEAADFKTEYFALDISGAGEFDVYVTEELDINASGAVEVKYKGDPAVINRKVSGAASIEPM